MKTQIQALIAMMKRGWMSTAMAEAAGITSPGSRLSEFKRNHGFRLSINGNRPVLYEIGRKDYSLKSRDRTVMTRWGKATRIREYRLQAVK